ncbi:hypothetical protein G9C98_001780 [Cotesia typhae]|uniref:Uncharacterized protein n=1 Tax=Cotesia typhae TaxID=2053667 RepID=A0A8J5R426_9HYME|nr:hypothetical protein G9C98_001780 [Cotesia typhae]
MSFKVAVVLFAMIVATHCSHNVSPRRIWTRERREAPSIVIGNVDNQMRNNFVIGESGSILPGSQVVSGSVLTQANNEYVTISETGKLVVVMPDVIVQPEPLTVLGLNDAEVRQLLNLTPAQKNGMIIINLRLSLSILGEYCERIAQKVDKAIVEKTGNLENASKSFYRNHIDENMWYIELKSYLDDVSSNQSDLDELIDKIKVGDTISDSEVSRARRLMKNLLKAHLRMTRQSQTILNSSS